MLQKLKLKQALLSTTLLILILTSCATTNPTTFFTSETHRKLAESFTSSEETELELRFGQLSRVVNQDWLRITKNGDARALKFSWVVPGVTMVMKEVWWNNTTNPQFRDHVLEWSPYSNRITWVSLSETNINFSNFDSIENYSAHTRSHGQYDVTKGIPYIEINEKSKELEYLGASYYQDNSNVIDEKLKLVLAKESKSGHQIQNIKTPAAELTQSHGKVANEQEPRTIAPSKAHAGQTDDSKVEPETKASDFAKMYPILKANKSKDGKLKLNSKTKEVMPEIYLFDAEQDQKIQVSVSTKNFTPIVAAYQFDSDISVSSIPGSSSSSSQFYFADKGLYLVLVTSLNNKKGGNFKIVLKEITE